MLLLLPPILLLWSFLCEGRLAFGNCANGGKEPILTASLGQRAKGLLVCAKALLSAPLHVLASVHTVILSLRDDFAVAASSILCVQRAFP